MLQSNINVGCHKEGEKRAIQFIIFCDLKRSLTSSKYVSVLDLIIKVLKIIILINYSREDNFTQPLFAEKII